jgi:alpha-tubulin suppressor-like RCC1 family protein
VKITFFYLLVFCTLFWTVSNAQSLRYYIGTGEYQNFILDNSNGKLYAVGNNAATEGLGSNTGTFGMAIPTSLASSGIQITYVASALHNAMAIDASGKLYFGGVNDGGQRGDGSIGGTSNSFVQVLTDSLGNPFNNVSQVYCFSNSNNAIGWVACKKDGTVWICGATFGGMRGNGQTGQSNPRPVQINFPAGVSIVKVIAGVICMALDSKGGVWTWGGSNNPYLLGSGAPNNVDYTHPHQVTLPQAAKDIAGDQYYEYALGLNGTLYGWGYYGAYMGVGTGGYFCCNQSFSLPRDLTNDLLLPHPIASIATNTTSSYAILTDGTLWAWGGSECGQIGNGIEINYPRYTIDPPPYGGAIPSPYDWDQGVGELMQVKPVQIAVGKNDFTAVFGASGGAVFYAYAEDSKGQLYSWGRNKNGVLGNGVVPSSPGIAASYPNSWDVPWITAVNPFGALPNSTVSTSPYCLLNPNGSPCNQYKEPTFKTPVPNAGPNQIVNLPTSSTTLDGSGSSDPSGRLVYYLWTQVSGPSAATIVINTAQKPLITGLNPGVYVFKLKVTDNGWLSDSANVTVTVNVTGPQPPVANAGPNQTITLPTNSATLTGSGSEINGKIVSYQWTQVNGPSTATIGTPGTAQTTVSALVQGLYTFQLTVTDSAGVKANAQVTVTVNPALIPGPPVANAGSDQGITLPTSSVTLTGSGSETNGTIVSYAWTQLSGPSTATIVSPGQAQTTVNGLIAGAYLFQLTVTDNSGKTASDQVKITVTPAVLPGPPVANAGPDQGIVLPNNVTLTGSGSETNGTIVSYLWAQISGPSTATIATPSQAQTIVSGLVPGVYLFQLTVTDNSGKTASDVVKITVNPAVVPGPPSANAGSDQTITLPTNSVTLTGSGSETNGTIVSYLWAQISGPSTSTMVTPGQSQTTVNSLVAGVYVFQLTVTDNSGVTASNVVKITVNAAIVPGPPSANAGPDQGITLPINSVTLSGSGSESNGTIVSYQWIQISGPSTATILTPSQAQTTVNALVPGVYLFQLTVTDNSGVTASDVVKITVNPAVVVPGTPVANAGPNQTITLPTNSVTLTGSGSETNGKIVSYQWTQISGPSTATINPAGQAQTTISALTQGTFTFQLKVTDSLGVSATDVAKVTVNAAIVQGPPTVTAGSNQTITLPANSVTLTATASETNGSIVSYQWTQISGPSAATLGSSSQAQTTAGPLVQGIYTFQILVTDNVGATASDVVKITVNPSAVKGTPTVNAGGNQTITLPANTITLTATASEINGSILSYQWTQISGPSAGVIAASNQAQTSVSGLLQGVYTFQITVTDNSGVTASDVAKITVNAAVVKGNPIVDAGANQIINLPANSVTLSATASETNGSIVSYQWTQLSGPAAATFASPGQAQTLVSGLVQGVYNFQILVTDNSGVNASDVVKVTVNAVLIPGPPVVSAGTNQSVTLPTSSTILTATASEVNGTIVSYQWVELSGPSNAAISSPDQAQTAVSGLVEGVYAFQITVTDNSGITASDVAIVTVNQAANLFPVADAGQDQTFNLTQDSSFVATLDGSDSYSPIGSSLIFQWTQVSGAGGVTIANASTAIASVYGLLPGTYTFKLTVTDNQGNSSSAEATLTVNLTLQKMPVAMAGKDTTLGYPASSLMLDGSGSYDPGGTIVQYSWTQISGPASATLSNPTGVSTSASQLLIGDYVFQLTVTDNNNQTSTSTVHVSVINTLRSPDFISVYPNPVVGNMIYVNGIMEGAGKVNMILYDMNGKAIINTVFEKTSVEFQQTIQTPNLARGMYILTIRFDGATSPYSFKLIKQ